ncbi:MAG: hypothetical protein WDW36_000517 [Sanguina aurantia]
MPPVRSDPFLNLNTILSAQHAAPGSISRACLAVNACVINNRDNLRGFFDICLPMLLKRVFGYDDFEASWLHAVKFGRDQDCQELVRLLSPNGNLFAAIASADSLGLIQYIFPIERLPAHTQQLLKSSAGIAELSAWPQYAGRISLDGNGKPQVLLNVLSFFMFWNAFYVLRDGGSALAAAGRSESRVVGTASPYMPQSIYRLGTSLIGAHGHTATGGPLRNHPYQQLLRSYLSHFIPRTSSATSAASNRLAQAASSGPGTSRAHAGSQQPTPGEVMLSVLVEFWLTDVAEPIPSPTARTSIGSLGQTIGAGQQQQQPGPVLGGQAGLIGAVGDVTGSGAFTMLNLAAVLRPPPYQPPAEELVAALDALIRYSTTIEPAPGTKDRVRPAQPSQLSAATPTHTHTPLHASATNSMNATGGSSSSGGGLVSWLPATRVRTLPGPPARLLQPPACAMLAGCGPAGPAAQALARKTYRFLRRAMTQWPCSSGASFTSLTSLWLSVLTPWAPNNQRPFISDSNSHSHAGGGGGGGGSATANPGGGGGGFGAGAQRQQQQQQGGAGGGAAVAGRPTAAAQCPPFAISSQRLLAITRSSPTAACYTPEWRPHVLSHLPFYTILLPAFLELTLARLPAKADPALQDLLQVLQALADSPALLSQLKEVESAFNSYATSSHIRPEANPTYGDLLPWLLEQAHDWETSATSGAPFTASPTLNNNNNNSNATSAHPAAAAAAAAAAGAAGSLGNTASPAKPHTNTSYRLFSVDAALGRCAPTLALAVIRHQDAQGNPALLSQVHTAARAVLPLNNVPSLTPTAAPVENACARQYPKGGNWKAVSYRGDALFAPIASYEVARLVRPLVRLSLRINTLLGLDRELSAEELEEMPETVVTEGLRWLRRRRFRVSLRCLAEKQILAWLLGLYFVLLPILKWLLSALFLGSSVTAQ